MKNHLFEKVAWCVVDDIKVRSNINLLDWLRNIQFYAQKKEANYFFPNGDKLFFIEKEYWLCESEFDCARKILCEYKKNLIQKYFAEQLTEYRYAKKMTEAEFFVSTLKDFLERCQCEDTFYGNQMYNTKERKNLGHIGHWGNSVFVHKSELTDFAVVYHKMYLIAQIYCLTLRKKPFDNSDMSYKNAEDTKKVLDTKEIEISIY